MNFDGSFEDWTDYMGECVDSFCYEIGGQFFTAICFEGRMVAALKATSGNAEPFAVEDLTALLEAAA